jgi:AcrR family transcriptional regulator
VDLAADRGSPSSVIEHLAADCSESEAGSEGESGRSAGSANATASAHSADVAHPGKGINRPANVGRATFYAHFDSKEDLLASGIEELRASLRERQHQALSSTTADDRLFAFSCELFVHADAHRTVFRAMVGKRSGAVVQQLLHKMLVDLVREELKLMSPTSRATETPAEAIAQFIGGGLFGLLIWWANGKMRMPVKEVDALFRRLARR